MIGRIIAGRYKIEQYPPKLLKVLLSQEDILVLDTTRKSLYATQAIKHSLNCIWVNI